MCVLLNINDHREGYVLSREDRVHPGRTRSLETTFPSQLRLRFFGLLGWWVEGLIEDDSREGDKGNPFEVGTVPTCLGPLTLWSLNP